MHKFFAALCLVLCVCSAAAQTQVRKCDNKKPLPLAVKLDDCVKMPCDVWTGSSSDLAVHFVATKDEMTNIRAQVEVTALGLQMPFDLIEERSDVCRNLLFGAYCPLDAGEDVVYHLPLQVSAHQPEVPSKLEVHLWDRTDDSVVACFIADLRVKRGVRAL